MCRVTGRHDPAVAPLVVARPGARAVRRPGGDHRARPAAGGRGGRFRLRDADRAGSAGGAAGRGRGATAGRGAAVPPVGQPLRLAHVARPHVARTGRQRQLADAGAAGRRAVGRPVRRLDQLDRAGAAADRARDADTRRRHGCGRTRRAGGHIVAGECGAGRAGAAGGRRCVRDGGGQRADRGASGRGHGQPGRRLRAVRRVRASGGWGPGRGGHRRALSTRRCHGALGGTGGRGRAAGDGGGLRRRPVARRGWRGRHHDGRRSERALCRARPLAGVGAGVRPAASPHRDLRRRGRRSGERSPRAGPVQRAVHRGRRGGGGAPAALRPRVAPAGRRRAPGGGRHARGVPVRRRYAHAPARGGHGHDHAGRLRRGRLAGGVCPAADRQRARRPLVDRRREAGGARHRRHAGGRRARGRPLRGGAHRTAGCAADRLVHPRPACGGESRLAAAHDQRTGAAVPGGRGRDGRQPAAVAGAQPDGGGGRGLAAGRGHQPVGHRLRRARDGPRSPT